MKAVAAMPRTPVAAKAPLPARIVARIIGISRRSPTLAIGAAIILFFAFLAVFLLVGTPWVLFVTG